MEPNPTFAFGPHLARLRQEAGLSQQALADRLSVTRQAVSNWERGQTLPDLETLRRIAQVLGTDLNTLGGFLPPAPQARRGNARRGRRLLAGVILAGLCALSFLGGRYLPLERDPALPAQGEAEESLLPAHRVRYTTPSGITVITAADGWEELTALFAALPPEAEAGEVALTPQQRDVFRYFAQQYELFSAPEYSGEEGFSSWEGLLLWLYRAGISRGGVMEPSLVDGSLAELFGPQVPYRHQSTARFPLTQEGYVPAGVGGTWGESYRLSSLVKLEDGRYEAAFTCQPGAEITLTLAVEDGTPVITAIRPSGGEAGEVL